MHLYDDPDDDDEDDEDNDETRGFDRVRDPPPLPRGISAAVSVAANHNICPQAARAHLLRANS